MQNEGNKNGSFSFTSYSPDATNVQLLIKISQQLPNTDGAESVGADSMSNTRHRNIFVH